MPDTSIWYPIELVSHGPTYRLWGVFTLDIHLLRTSAPAQAVGSQREERLGRDFSSRVIHGARLSLSIGLVGVALSLP